MQRLVPLLAALALAPGVVSAHHKPGHSGGPGNARPATVAAPAIGHCPPGLARKEPPCIPPGQARKAGYDVGDRYDPDPVYLDRDSFDLPPLRDGEGYVRVGDSILRLDREERIILDVVTLLLD